MNFFDEDEKIYDMSMWYAPRVLKKFEDVFVSSFVAVERRYTGNGMENPNVMEVTPGTVREVVADLSRMRSGMRHIKGGMSVGKTTRVTRALADLLDGTVLVISPTSTHAANAAYSVNSLMKEEFAGCRTLASLHNEVSGNLLFMDSESFLYDHARGKLSDKIAMVVFDENDSTYGSHMATGEVLRYVMKEIPVVTMSGTPRGSKPVCDFSNLTVCDYASACSAVRGRRLIFRKSGEEASEEAKRNKAEYISPFMSYKSMAELCTKLREKELDVYSGPQLSEGLNFPFDVVVDNRSKLQVAVVSNDLVLSAVSVSTSDHIQRAGRLREGGTYYGPDVKESSDLVLSRRIPDADVVNKDWWLQKLGLVVGEERSSRLLDLMVQKVSLSQMKVSHSEGREWYERVRDPFERSTVSVDERAKVFPLNEDNTSSKEDPPDKQDLVRRSFYGDEGETLVGSPPRLRVLGRERLSGGLSLVKDRERLGVVGTGALQFEPEPGRHYHFKVMNGTAEVRITESVRELYISLLKKGEVYEMGYSKPDLALAISIWDYFEYSRVKTGCDVSRGISQFLASEIRSKFSYYFETMRWRSVWFVQIDFEKKLANRFDDFSFLGMEEESQSVDWFRVAVGNG